MHNITVICSRYYDYKVSLGGVAIVIASARLRELKGLVIVMLFTLRSHFQVTSVSPSL